MYKEKDIIYVIDEKQRLKDIGEVVDCSDDWNSVLYTSLKKGCKKVADAEKTYRMGSGPILKLKF